MTLGPAMPEELQEYHLLAAKTQDVLPPISLSRQCSSELSSVPSLSNRQMTGFLKADACKATHDVLESFQRQQSQKGRQVTEPATGRGMPPLAPRHGTAPAVPTYQSLGEIAPFSSGSIMHTDHGGGPEEDEEKDDPALSDSESSLGLSDEESDLSTSLIAKSITKAVDKCNSSLAVASPGTDCNLLAVSSQLAKMTGYSCEELLELGMFRCPALMSSLAEDEAQREGRMMAMEEGTDYTTVLVSRKKDGTYFINLVHMRGLVLAQSGTSDQQTWVLLLTFADVSHVDLLRTPAHNAPRLQKLARRIQKQCLKELGSNGLDNALAVFDTEWTSCSMSLTTEVLWRQPTSSCVDDPVVGEHPDLDKIRSHDDLPAIEAHNVLFPGWRQNPGTAVNDHDLVVDARDGDDVLTENSSGRREAQCLATGFIVCRSLAWLRRTLRW
eukprot:TRINITY_DN34446_c0_g1_i1.p1 TRINITY_DN34446_c0_g1~~TRINITY_DN34446_c0_g1_i1.p1  ORF type:complete len:441 (+),score=75.47 TRINITY_DN34446_c0_g1_i1:83-1405(+)